MVAKENQQPEIYVFTKTDGVISPYWLVESYGQ